MYSEKSKLSVVGRWWHLKVPRLIVKKRSGGRKSKGRSSEQGVHPAFREGEWRSVKLIKSRAEYLEVISVTFEKKKKRFQSYLRRYGRILIWPANGTHQPRTLAKPTMPITPGELSIRCQKSASNCD
jgi:hypothetical protein